jgi:uncharacterized protein
MADTRETVESIEPTVTKRRGAVLVTGATGFIGRHLCEHLLAQGRDVIVWRHRSGGPPSIARAAQVANLQQIPAEQPIDAVVNLAGARILGMPWTGARRRVLMHSRLDTTTALTQWLEQRQQVPRVLVNASAVGYYGVRNHERIDETAGPQPIFQSELCRHWEAAASRVASQGMRWVALRFGVVLGMDGGALPALVRSTRLGLGAVLGSGHQGFPWIHINDAVSMVTWAIDQPAVSGPVNAVAPVLVSQRDFQQVLSDVLGRKLVLRVPAWPLRLALGEMSQLLVDGQYIVPARAASGGFRHEYPGLRAALENLLPRG